MGYMYENLFKGFPVYTGSGDLKRDVNRGNQQPHPQPAVVGAMGMGVCNVHNILSSAKA